MSVFTPFHLYVFPPITRLSLEGGRGGEGGVDVMIYPSKYLKVFVMKILFQTIFVAALPRHHLTFSRSTVYIFQLRIVSILCISSLLGIYQSIHTINIYLSLKRRKKYNNFQLNILLVLLRLTLHCQNSTGIQTYI